MFITEPVTTLTDYAIALESLVFSGILLRRGTAWQQRSIQLWGAAFAAVAVAAGLGGTCHGFVEVLGNSMAGGLWQGMVYALSGASLLMLLATIKSNLPHRWQGWAMAAVGLKSAIGLGWIMHHYSADDGFSYGVADYLSSMLVVLLLAIGSFTHSVLTPAAVSKSTAAGWIVAGVLVSGVAIGLQNSGIRLAAWLNHNDLYHLVQMLALYLFFRGGCSLKEV
jgi:hypothetical protein